MLITTQLSRHFFHHTLFHEISHSVGPHRIIKDGEATTVNRSRREYHTVLEEAKADTLATCFLLTKDNGATTCASLKTYVAGFLRPIRFGPDKRPGGANCIQFNFLLQENGNSIDSNTGRIGIDPARSSRSIFSWQPP